MHTNLTEVEYALQHNCSRIEDGNSHNVMSNVLQITVDRANILPQDEYTEQCMANFKHEIEKTRLIQDGREFGWRQSCRNDFKMRCDGHCNMLVVTPPINPPNATIASNMAITINAMKLWRKLYMMAAFIGVVWSLSVYLRSTIPRIRVFVEKKFAVQPPSTAESHRLGLDLPPRYHYCRR